MFFDVFIKGIYKGTVGLVNSAGSMLPVMLIALILGSCIIFCAIGVPFVASEDIMNNNLIQQFFDGTISQSDYYGVLCVVLVIGITIFSIIPYVILISFRKINYVETILMLQITLYVIVMQYTNYQDFLLTSQGFYEWLAFIVGIFALLLLGTIGGMIVAGIEILISAIISIPIMIFSYLWIKHKLKQKEVWKTIESFLIEQDYMSIKRIEIANTGIEIFNIEDNKIDEVEFDVKIKGIQYEILCNMINKKVPPYFGKDNDGNILINKQKAN